MRALIVDALVGNDYAICLCQGLDTQDVETELITVDGRSSPFEVAFPIRGWAPSKKSSSSKMGKVTGYVRYLFKLYSYLHKAKKKSRAVAHFQFFRRERVESFFLLALRLSGIRLVYTAHNILPHESTWLDRFLKSIVYHSSHAIIVHSNYVKKALLDVFQVDANKIFVVPHGNFDHYLPESPISREEARAALGLKKEDKVLLFFGYIREYKGLDLLLEAFDKAALVDPQLKLVIAGAPHTEALARSTKSFIARSRAKERIVFHDRFIPHDAIKHYFTACDLVVLPYKHIYHSGIVHLAYSYGKAVLATDVGDFSETIVEGRSGFILPQNNAEALSEGIIGALTDDRKLEEMGGYAKDLSTQKYSWVDIGRQTSKVYDAIS